MLGITVTPTWKRKPAKTKDAVESPDTIHDNIAIAEEAIERIGVKVVLGTVVVVGASIAFATLGRVIETTIEHHLNKQ